MEANRQELNAPAAPTESSQQTPSSLANWLENNAPSILIWPAVLIVLFLSIFPLFVSLYLSLSRVRLVRGGYEVEFIGLDNYERLLRGSQARNFLGRYGDITLLEWSLIALLAAFMLYMLYSHIKRRGLSPVRLLGNTLIAVGVGAASWFTVRVLTAEEGALAGTWLEGQFWLLTAVPGMLVIITTLLTNSFSVLLRVFIAAFITVLAYISALTLGTEGTPGTLIVTLIFVFVGVGVQYLLGLGLALLVTQNLPGKRFFRVIFLLPMMITPVGIGFLFRMMTDTIQGPLSPIFRAVGLTDFTWVDSAAGARAAILIGDTWQWTPFMFIILLAALEGIPNDPIEAALVDGANRWQLFRFIIMPEVVPVSITLILIRLIEAFKIIDLPRVMTRGGPGTATESVTLYAFNQWKASATSIGFATAIGYALLFIVTFFSLVLVNIARRRLLEMTA